MFVLPSALRDNRIGEILAETFPFLAKSREAAISRTSPYRQAGELLKGLSVR